MTNTKTETMSMTKIKTNMKHLRRRFFRVSLVTNTKTETMLMTEIKANMKHLRRRIFQG